LRTNGRQLLILHNSFKLHYVITRKLAFLCRYRASWLINIFKADKKNIFKCVHAFFQVKDRNILFKNVGRFYFTEQLVT